MKGPSPGHGRHLARGLGMCSTLCTGLAVQRERRHGKQGRQQAEGHAPTQVIGSHAPEPLPRHHAGDRGPHEATQRGLALLIAHLVTDPGHRQGDDAGGRAAHGRTRQHQHVQAGCQRGQGTEDRATCRGQIDHADLAQAIAQRAIKQLQHAIGHGKGGDDTGGFARADIKVMTQRAEHRIAHPHRGHAAESSQAQQSQGQGQGVHSGLLKSQ